MKTAEPKNALAANAFSCRDRTTCNLKEQRVHGTLAMRELGRTMKALVAVVDDNEAVRDALATILVLEGYCVRTYASGDAFMRTFGQMQQPDCVLLDLVMPDGSGADVLQVLDSATTPVIVISGADSCLEALAGIHARGCAFMKKPFDADALLARIRVLFMRGTSGGCRQRQLPDRHQT